MIENKNQEQVRTEYKNVLINIIARHINPCVIYLFGSRARGTAHRGSDIDVAIDAGKEIDKFVLSSIFEEIEAANIPFFIDVIDLHSVDTEMKEHVIKTGIIWNSPQH